MKVNRIFKVAIDASLFTQTSYYNIEDFRKFDKKVKNLKIYLMVPCTMLDRKIPDGFKTVKDIELLYEEVEISLFVGRNHNFGNRLEEETGTKFIHAPEHIKSRIMIEFDRMQLKTTNCEDFKQHLPFSYIYKGWVFPDGFMMQHADFTNHIILYDHYTAIEVFDSFENYEEASEFYIEYIIKDEFIKVKV